METDKKTEKKLLRKKIQRLRNELKDREQKNQIILKNLTESEIYQNAAYIFPYVSYKSEVDTRQLIVRAFKDGKTVAVPRVQGNDIKFYKITSIEDLELGTKEILEPKSECRELDASEGLMILPGTVFDKECRRIGYGGGFYDRYINHHSGVYMAALAYECQVLDEIPYEQWDKSVNCIITEEGFTYESKRNGRKCKSGSNGSEYSGHK